MMGESKAVSSNRISNNISSKNKIGSADFIKCPHCAGPLSKDMETSRWTVPPLIRDSFSMIGSAVGGVTSAFYGFNHVMPVVQRKIKGPMWLHFLIGAPPIIVFSSACAGLAGLYISSEGIAYSNMWYRSSTSSASIYILSCHDLLLISASILATG